jgi:hypothetical protein
MYNVANKAIIVIIVIIIMKIAIIMKWIMWKANEMKKRNEKQ